MTSRVTVALQMLRLSTETMTIDAKRTKVTTVIVMVILSRQPCTLPSDVTMQEIVML